MPSPKVFHKCPYKPTFSTLWNWQKSYQVGVRRIYIDYVDFALVCVSKCREGFEIIPFYNDMIRYILVYQRITPQIPELWRGF